MILVTMSAHAETMRVGQIDGKNVCVSTSTDCLCIKAVYISSGFSTNAGQDYQEAASQFNWPTKNQAETNLCNNLKSQFPLEVWTVKKNSSRVNIAGKLDYSRTVYGDNDKPICNAPMGDICGQQVSGYKEYWRSFQCPNGIGRTVCEVK